MLYDKSVAGYKVKDALKNGGVWQIGVEIGVNSERTIDLLCRSSFLVSHGNVTGPLAVCVARGLPIDRLLAQ